MKKDYICTMLNSKKYIFNPETLSYEVQKVSGRRRAVRSLLMLAGSVVLAFFYFWIYTSVLGLELPKTQILKQANESWRAKVDVLNSRMDEYEEVLSELQLRDDKVYRAVYGMGSISSEIREAGFGGVNRYSYLERADDGQMLMNTLMRLDRLTKKACVQSKSFDDVQSVSKMAGDMASSVPAIPPVSPDTRISSTFGVRTDPISGLLSRHMGMDFAMKPGCSVYVTGDGVVEQVVYSRIGYGNCVVVNHGFGYKTRYAHLSAIFVSEGDKIKRGDFIAKTGNTGKSSGPHLHYEVIYMGQPINPYNFLDMTIPVEEYSSMVRHSKAESELTLHPSHRRK